MYRAQRKSKSRWVAASSPMSGLLGLYDDVLADVGLVGARQGPHDEHVAVGFAHDFGCHVPEEAPDDRRVADGAEDEGVDLVLLGGLEEGHRRLGVDEERRAPCCSTIATASSKAFVAVAAPGTWPRVATWAALASWLALSRGLSVV